MFSCPKIAGGGRHHNVSKLLEIKGYEVFRVDRSFEHTYVSERLQRIGPERVLEGFRYH